MLAHRLGEEAHDRLRYQNMQALRESGSMSDKKIRDLEKRVKDLERKLEFFINSFNLSSGDRIADLNERTRRAMEQIANELNVPLFSLFDHSERFK